MNPMECSSIFERNYLAIDKRKASGGFECLWAYPFKRYYQIILRRVL
jgi:hypothetical protein